MTKKNKDYWPHPANLRNDRRFRRLMKDLPGAVGYGVAVITIERLRCEPNYSYPLADLDLLADEFDISVPILQTVITKYDLFDIREEKDGEMMFSPFLDELMEPYKERIEQARIAGHISAKKRKLKQLKQLEELSLFSSTERQLNSGPTEEKRKEEKRKEEKKIDLSGLGRPKTIYKIYSVEDEQFIPVNRDDKRLITLASQYKLGRIKKNGSFLTKEEADLIIREVVL